MASSTSTDKHTPLTDQAVTDAADTSAAADSDTEKVVVEGQSRTSASGKLSGLRQKPITVQQLLTGGALVILLVVVAVLSWRLMDKSDDYSALEQTRANEARAEQVALDYAVGAASMNFQDPAEWQNRLTAGTTPELADRLRKASTSMEQLIKPMQWTSSSEKLTAKVQSERDGVYQVAAFVSVLTKNVQAPAGIESTATYRMTIDSNNDWVISEISGIPTSLGGGSGPK
ncbi:hypothetical protein [Gordonia amicalis]|uniref:hypothetical protein n=1 Tax=Gordonia amicalis TaxID=89053 RepID=UPI0002A62A59|nr:hypothetical protein [Gordonia amicalis]MBA5849421.1 hypothetical protein [Gordonia amicalis]MDV7171880.1 hypothetical protein [Gordonia amicalis]NKX78578.1 hypothetical protein [Gordonia amicalis]UOG22573.1 hypothetical protein MTX80_06160 [Gordonia amicalis]GAC51846.1 hypothetical protein GOAMI_04_00820 [Gordonia amicalis NBRC 100051 = JCM 11271]